MATQEPPFHVTPDYCTDLVRQAVRAPLVRRNGTPRWVAVMEMFAVGSTRANQLCAHFGFNADDELKRY